MSRANGYQRGYRGGGGYRRGRGRGGFGGYRPRTKEFRLHIFTDIEESNQLILRLVSSIPEFENFVRSESLSENDTFQLLAVLVRCLDNDLHSGSVGKILRVVCTSPSRFMDVHLLRLINILPNQSLEIQIKIVENITLLTSYISEKLPTHASKGLLLITAVLNLQSVVSKLKRSKPRVVLNIQDAKTGCEQSIQDTRWKNQRRGGPHDDGEIPPEDFTELPIFPSLRDMDWKEDHFLRANKSQGAFRDVDHYLDVQFRLLREDYIQPLRKGIKEFQEKKKSKQATGQIQDVRLYHRVRIIDLVCGKQLEHQLQFDNTEFQNMRWQSSKRLIHGSLVCLSPDDFTTIYFAVVTNRNILDLQKGIIQVKFENCLSEILDLSGDEVFTMAECVTFFEAHRHVLKGMQELSQAGRGFPMSRYFVECSTDIRPPAYLLSGHSRGHMDLKCLLRDKNDKTPISVNVLRGPWPSLQQTTFNQSQLEAVTTALTKELAIIQGPPGTGKTYVGLKIAKVLIQNRSVWNNPGESKPILVVCYTNHALDQFLEGIFEFLPKGIVRVGSRSKNRNLDPLNLKKLRQDRQNRKEVNLSTRNSIKDCLRDRNAVRENLEKASAKLEATKEGIVSENVLRDSMPSRHYTSLTNGVYSYGSRRRPRSIMVGWLTEGTLDVADEDDDEICRRLAQEITSKILSGEDTVTEETVTAETVLDLPYPKRAQLYRHWRNTMSNMLRGTTENHRRLQEMTKKEILPDSVLEHVVGTSIFMAITSHVGAQVLETHGQTSNHCIKSWLGIPEFSQDEEELQKVLEQLTDVTGAEEVQLNVDEEAMVLESHRHLDDEVEDEDSRGRARRRRYLENAIDDLGVDTTLTQKAAANTTGEWQVSASQRRKQAKRLLQLLKTENPMTEVEASRVRDVWSESLGVRERVRLYLFWLRRYQAQLKERIQPYAAQYVIESERLAELRFGEDCDILQEAQVIGMTTTGAARYRKVLANIGCPIVILEEAAEVLEAHVLTTLNESCQHLILIGDHQQLRPSPTVYELCRHYQLDVSLFERLVNNHLHHSTLGVQHRMRPEISRFVRHVYPHLQDHASTQNRPHIQGVKQDVFLLHHEIKESQQKDNSSKLNIHEAEFCVRLCKYLLQQNYNPEKITILAAYSGQVSAIWKIIRQYDTYFQGVRVTTVDNYQGEENDVIILSLVRSNEEGSVGFLGTDNRVCVALSRARNGFYAFGNFLILANKSHLWKNIVQTAENNGQLGESLVLRCSNHPEIETSVSSGQDFHKVSEGGCRLPCSFAYRSCRHQCGRKCHTQDMEHKSLKCRQTCAGTCPLGHRCKKKCAEEHQCERTCDEKVLKILPSCGHEAIADCSTDPLTVCCGKQCAGRLDCGHQCTRTCGYCKKALCRRSVCLVEVERQRSCGHFVKSACHKSPDDTPCSKPCGAKLDCGHSCRGKCGQCLRGRLHETCKEKCGKPLPACGHKCPLPCGTKCLPCKEKCTWRCKHKKCELPCGTSCKPCQEPCPWTCKHLATPCQATCDNPCKPCGLPCLQKLQCEHVCRGLCGEKCICYICEKDKFVKLSQEEISTVNPRYGTLIKLPACGHIFVKEELWEYLKQSHVLLTDGQAFKCPSCSSIVMEWDLWQYHDVFQNVHHSRRQKKQKRIDEITASGWFQTTSSSLAPSSSATKTLSSPKGTMFKLSTEQVGTRSSAKQVGIGLSSHQAGVRSSAQTLELGSPVQQFEIRSSAQQVGVKASAQQLGARSSSQKVGVRSPAQVGVGSFAQQVGVTSSAEQVGVRSSAQQVEVRSSLGSSSRQDNGGLTTRSSSTTDQIPSLAQRMRALGIARASSAGTHRLSSETSGQGKSAV